MTYLNQSSKTWLSSLELYNKLTWAVIELSMLF